MKLTLLTENITKKLPFVNHAVSSKSQLPVLLHILLEAENNVLKISATDLEIGIEVVIAATVEEAGSVTVPAKIFTELLLSLPSGKVTFQTKGDKLEVVSSKTKTVFQTIAKEEFPHLYEEQGEELTTISKEVLEKDFSKVVFAASPDTTRPALSGVLLSKQQQADAGGFLLVATDGYRLSLKHSNSSKVKKTDWEKPLLIPSRVIKEIILAKLAQEDISLFVSEKSSQVLFVQNETVLVGRLIEATYPNYEKIIPADFETQVSFDRQEMQKAVKIASIFARETANIIRFSIKKDKIEVSANTPSVGEQVVEVEAKTSGEENDIAFNARYLLDFFANISEDDITFEMTGPLNPGVFKIKNDPSFLHLIMPIRVQNEE
jgi:DNA polymerase-3 subunit beta